MKISFSQTPQDKIIKSFKKYLDKANYKKAYALLESNSDYKTQLTSIWQTEYHNNILEQNFMGAISIASIFPTDKQLWITPASTSFVKKELEKKNYKAAANLLREYPVDYHEIVKVLNKLETSESIDLNKLLESIEPQVARDKEETVRILNLASNFLARNPFREGYVLNLPPDNEIFITGDLHGNRKNLDLILNKANLGDNPNRHLVLQEIVHSRCLMIDQRDLSFLEILDILKYLVDYPQRVHILLGNHDLNVYREKNTLRGSKNLDVFFERGLEFIFGKDFLDILELYRKVIENMAACIKSGPVFLSHSNPDYSYKDFFTFEELKEDSPLSKNKSIRTLVMGRDHSDKALEFLIKEVGVDFSIIGHEICRKGYEISNSYQIILDTCHNLGRYMVFVPSEIDSMEKLCSKIKPVRKGV